MVNSQDLVGMRNVIPGTAATTVWADLDGNGGVDINDHNWPINLALEILDEGLP